MTANSGASGIWGRWEAEGMDIGHGGTDLAGNTSKFGEDPGMGSWQKRQLVWKVRWLVTELSPGLRKGATTKDQSWEVWN